MRFTGTDNIRTPLFSDSLVVVILIRFLRRVEEGFVTPVVGGQIVDIVGADQDPDKMDLEKIMNAK